MSKDSTVTHTPGPSEINTLGGPNRTEVFCGNVLICDTLSGTATGSGEAQANAAYISSSWNACLSIPGNDPAAAITAARQAIRAAVVSAPYEGKEEFIRTSIHNALALIGATP